MTASCVPSRRRVSPGQHGQGPRHDRHLGVAVVGLAVVLLVIHPALVLLLAVSLLPLWWANISRARDYYRYSVRITPTPRESSATSRDILTLLDSAKETRAFGLGPYLLDKQQRLFDKAGGAAENRDRKRMRRDVLATLASSVVSAGGLLLILWLHFSERISIAEPAPRPGAAADDAADERAHDGHGQVRTRTHSSSRTSGPSSTSRRSWPPTRREPRAALGLSRISVSTSASPIRTRPAGLRNVRWRSGAGETVAIVGENGAGKTTLAKLLCRLYEPDAGTISWDGRDLRSFDPDELRAQYRGDLPGLRALSAVGTRERRLRRRRLDRGPRCDRRGGAPGRRRRLPDRLPEGYETDARPACSRTATSCRSASGRRWRSRARSSATPRLWSWTSPPPRSTPVPSTSCSRRCASCSGTAPCCSSRIASRASGWPTASTSCEDGGSCSRAPTTS